MSIFTTMEGQRFDIGADFIFDILAYREVFCNNKKVAWALHIRLKNRFYRAILENLPYSSQVSSTCYISIGCQSRIDLKEILYGSLEIRR